MSTLKVDTIATRSGSGNITASNTIVGNLTGNVTGNPSFGGTLAVTGKITSTAGITFGSDTAAENVLDDYEEGTHTMTFTMTGSGTASAGRNKMGYTKIGNMVTCTSEMQIGSVSSPVGSLRISLPYVIKNNTGDRENFFGFSPVPYNAALANGHNIVPICIGNANVSYVTFLYPTSNGAFADFTPTANDVFNFTFSYFTN